MALIYLEKIGVFSSILSLLLRVFFFIKNYSWYLFVVFINIDLIFEVELIILKYQGVIVYNYYHAQ